MANDSGDKQLTWGDSFDLLSIERKQELRDRLESWTTEQATPAKRGPFAGERLNGLEVFWLAACALAVTGSNRAVYDVTFTENMLVQRVQLPALNLNGADLNGADLSLADLGGADLGGADLRRADLGGAQIIDADLSDTNLSDCYIYGASVWNVKLDGATQTNLRITPDGEAEITVDNLEVAQFLYLMLHNDKIRSVIDTIARKLVLILGRFTPERKVILDALRDELRLRNYLPVVFDFEKTASRDLTEMVSTLAHMARFVIADLTDARSIPQELSAIIPNLPSVAVQPLIQADDTEYAMFEHWRRYDWVLETYRYDDLDALLAMLKEHVIDPAEQRANAIAPLKG